VVSFCIPWFQSSSARIHLDVFSFSTVWRLYLEHARP
jgi:hypothetical protein